MNKRQVFNENTIKTIFFQATKISFPQLSEKWGFGKHGRLIRSDDIHHQPEKSDKNLSHKLKADLWMDYDIVERRFIHKSRVIKCIKMFTNELSDGVIMRL